LLTAAFYGSGDFVEFCGSEDEDYIRRGFFYSFE
jgi:hypothetical protein